MKIKNKSVAIKVGLGIAVVLGVVLSVGYSFNKIDTEVVEISSSLDYIQEQLGVKVDSYKSVKKNIEKYDESDNLIKSIDDEISITDKYKNIDFDNFNSKIMNERINSYNKLNEKIDAVIDLYDENKDMSDDKVLSESINNLIDSDSNLERATRDFNQHTREDFNKAIKGFPTNIVAKSKGITPIDKFDN